MDNDVIDMSHLDNESDDGWINKKGDIRYCATNVSIVSLLRRMKRKLESSGNNVYKTICFHKDDRGPSLVVYGNTNTFCAFCCGHRGGGPIQLMQFALESKGLPHSRAEAISQIHALFGDSISQNVFDSLSSTEVSDESTDEFARINMKVRDYLEAISHLPIYKNERDNFDLLFKKIDVQYPHKELANVEDAKREKNKIFKIINEKIHKLGIDL